MFSSVSSWLGGAIKPSDDEGVKVTISENPEEICSPQDKTEEENKNVDAEAASVVDGENKKPEDPDLSELGNQAYNAAKEWGGYLFSVGKSATKSLASSAVSTAKSFTDQTILGDFSKQQETFVVEKKERQARSEAAVAPWVGYHEEDKMKVQILQLSKDKRNFLRNPPHGVQFHFDFDASFPVAMATLAEDESLKKMRFELVPRLVQEEVFWRNYFYRVSLIKQSAQLTTLAQMSGERSSGSSRRSSTGEPTSPSPVPSASNSLPGGPVTSEAGGNPTQLAGSPDNEFVSDAFQGKYSDEDLKREMQQLGVANNKSSSQPTGGKTDGDEDWERELQAELNDYELVSDGKLDDDLENELMKEIEAEAGVSK